MIEEAKHVVPARTVLMFSGGLDSVALAHLCSVDTLLYVDAGTRYAAKELAHCKRQAWCIAKLAVDNSLNLAAWERADAVVPMRNALFAMVGARYGSTLLFGFTEGDGIADKSHAFLADMTALLSKLHAPSWWCEGAVVNVVAPYKDFTKAEILRAYVAAGHPVQRLVDSVSCYDADSEACGVCKCCVRKWVALQGVGIDLRDTNPAYHRVTQTEHYQRLATGGRGREGDHLEHA